MKYDQLEPIIISLPHDKKIPVYSNKTHSLYLLRPSKVSARFKTYDINKNFQIWLHINGAARDFKPNHFRLLIDLYNRVREAPDSKRDLLLVFDKIFYGDDPLDLVGILEKYKYSQCIDPIDITLSLAQLFIAEQNIGFNKNSKYNPKSLYIQGWIRNFIHSDYEIDQILAGISRFRPPLDKYTQLDNKNHKNYNASAGPLWYT